MIGSNEACDSSALLLTLGSVEVSQAHGTVMEPLHRGSLGPLRCLPPRSGPRLWWNHLAFRGNREPTVRGSGDSTSRSLDIT